jgi:transporter family-2 protein
MQNLFMILGLLVGAGLSAQSVVNAKVTLSMGLWGATFVSFFVAMVLMGVAACSSSQLAPQKLWILPPQYWVMSGVLGAFMVAGRTFLVPQVGVGMTMVLVIAGQLVSGVLMDSFGVLGSPIHAFSATRGVACLLLIGGVILMQR